MKTLAIASRELRSYFATPIGWLVLTGFLFLSHLDNFFFDLNVLFRRFFAGFNCRFFLDCCISLSLFYRSFRVTFLANDNNFGLFYNYLSLTFDGF